MVGTRRFAHHAVCREGQMVGTIDLDQRMAALPGRFL
jgi:hypothetical protein